MDTDVVAVESDEVCMTLREEEASVDDDMYEEEEDGNSLILLRAVSICRFLFILSAAIKLIVS